jgi:hypothetical protein
MQPYCLLYLGYFQLFAAGDIVEKDPDLPISDGWNAAFTPPLYQLEFPVHINIDTLHQTSRSCKISGITHVKKNAIHLSGLISFSNPGI